MKNRILYFLGITVCLFTVFSCRTAKQKSNAKKVYMNKTYLEIKNAIHEAEVTKLNDTVKVLFPSNLMFGFNSASINSEVAPSMNRFADALNKFEKTAILISGYTDSIGTDEYNEKLSAQRADTAKAALVNNKVANQRINTWGMGKRHPIATNETEEGRALNRRVEFIILYDVKK